MSYQRCVKVTSENTLYKLSTLARLSGVMFRKNGGHEYTLEASGAFREAIDRLAELYGDR